MTGTAASGLARRRDATLRAGVCAARLAAELGTDGATVARWLTGEVRITPVALCDAVELLGVPVESFFRDCLVADDGAAFGATVH